MNQEGNMIRKRQRQFEDPAITIILSADEKGRDGEAYLFPSNTRLRNRVYPSRDIHRYPYQVAEGGG